MQIEATLLGTGTSQGIPVIGCDCPVCISSDEKDKRLRASLLIKVNGQNFVVDAGPDFRQQMLREQVSSLRAILITHEHADHIFGLDDIRSYNWLQKRTMDIYAEERVQKALIRIFDYVFSDVFYPGLPKMNLNLINGESFFIDKVKFKGAEMDNDYQGAGFTLTVEAEAIQATNGAINDQWGVDPIALGLEVL